LPHEKLLARRSRVETGIDMSEIFGQKFSEYKSSKKFTSNQGLTLDLDCTPSTSLRKFQMHSVGSEKDRTHSWATSNEISGIRIIP
jgi:hypothetical protein